MAHATKKDIGFQQEHCDLAAWKNNRGNFQSKFKGKTEALEEHIYNVGVGNQADMFVRTTKEVAEYAGRHCKQSLDIRSAIEKLTDTTIATPQPRSTGNTTIYYQKT